MDPSPIISNETFASNLETLISEPWGGWDVSFVPVDAIRSLIDNNPNLISTLQNDSKMLNTFCLLGVKIEQQQLTNPEVVQLAYEVNELITWALPQNPFGHVPEILRTIFSLLPSDTYKAILDTKYVVSCSKKWADFASANFGPTAKAMRLERIAFNPVEALLLINPPSESDLCDEFRKTNFSDYNSPGIDGSTFLEKAVVLNFKTLARELENEGVDLKLRCSVAATTNFLSKYLNFRSLQKLNLALIKHGADVKDFDNYLIKQVINNTFERSGDHCDVLHTLIDSIDSSAYGWIAPAAKKYNSTLAFKIIDKISYSSSMEKSLWHIVKSLQTDGNFDVVVRLIEKFAKLSNLLPLLIASKTFASERVMIELLNRGAQIPLDDIDLYELDSPSYFYETLTNKKYDLAFDLLDYNVDLNLWNETCGTAGPLEFLLKAYKKACPVEKAKIEKLFFRALEKGAKLIHSTWQNKTEKSLLGRAIKNGQSEVALALIQRGADQDLVNFCLSLEKAIDHSQKNVALALLKRGPSHDQKNPKIWICTIEALKNKDLEEVSLMAIEMMKAGNSYKDFFLKNGIPFEKLIAECCEIAQKSGSKKAYVELETL